MIRHQQRRELHALLATSIVAVTLTACTTGPSHDSDDVGQVIIQDRGTDIRTTCHGQDRLYWSTSFDGKAGGMAVVHQDSTCDSEG